MIITKLNLIHYIFQQNWKDDFTILNNIIDNRQSYEVRGIDDLNLRNSLIKIMVNNECFIFKQPKYLMNGATWLINSEAKFYQEFGQSFTKSVFDDKNYILVLGYLDEYNVTAFSKDENVRVKKIDELSKLLSDFHLRFAIKDKKVKTFIRKNFLTKSSVYISFFNQLKKGYHRNDYLDEMVFNSLNNRNDKDRRDVLYDFLQNATFFDVLDDFADEWFEFDNYLIHGDIGIGNILIRNNIPVLSDFELVSKGDNAWDVACLIESVLMFIRKQEGYSANIGLAFTNVFLDQYLQKLNLIENKKRFVIRVLKFLAIRKLEKFRHSQAGFSANYFFRELERIEKLFIETHKYYDHITNGDSEALTLFHK